MQLKEVPSGSICTQLAFNTENIWRWNSFRTNWTWHLSKGTIVLSNLKIARSNYDNSDFWKIFIETDDDGRIENKINLLRWTRQINLCIHTGCILDLKHLMSVRLRCTCISYNASCMKAKHNLDLKKRNGDNKDTGHFC